MNFNAELSRLYYLAQKAERDAVAFQAKAWRVYHAMLKEKRKLDQQRIKFSRVNRK